jgi:hypothetical protein
MVGWNDFHDVGVRRFEGKIVTFDVFIDENLLNLLRGSEKIELDGSHLAEIHAWDCTEQGYQYEIKDSHKHSA